MSIRYPENPHFNPLVLRVGDYKEYKESWAHDPSLFEDDDGTFYCFSTDAFRAPNGYQIRKSTDLIHWEYVGSAFDLANSKEAYARGEAYDKFSCLQPAYNWSLTKKSESALQICTKEDGSMGFWAPYVTKGADGRYWLYFALTGYFGGSKSCIGVAKSDKVTGPYNFEELIVCSAANWRSPNAIDPQIVYDAAGEMYMVYGSYGLGLYLIALDKNTGHRKDGYTRKDYDQGKCSFGEYFGKHLASGSIEGGVIKYHEGVDVLDRATGKWTKKNYYYLMCSFGSLSKVYNMRCGRSENIEGPYVDVNGNMLVCATDVGSGNKQMGSFIWEDTKIDFFCPGHNDMQITSKGINVISYHCRTHGVDLKPILSIPAPDGKKRTRVTASMKKNFCPHFLFISQYTFNSDGWLVMNPNRYAGEELQPVTSEEFIDVSDGEFSMVLFKQDAEQEKTTQAKRVYLTNDGKITGAYRGTWKMYGKNYIEICVEHEVYRGVVMPAWAEAQNHACLCATLMGERFGMAMYLNSYYRAEDLLDGQSLNAKIQG